MFLPQLEYSLHGLESLYAFMDSHREAVNSRFQSTEPAFLIFGTAIVTAIGLRLLSRLIYGEGKPV